MILLIVLWKISQVVFHAQMEVWILIARSIQHQALKYTIAGAGLSSGPPVACEK